MSHDKISAAARRRMAETDEPYAAARRAVIREHQAGAGAGAEVGAGAGAGAGARDGARDGARTGLHVSPGGLRSATASAAWTG